MWKSNDFITKTIGDNVKSKYEKYWSSIIRFNLICVAFVFDPLYKIRVMRFWQKECKGYGVG